jgi:hypothetical protein
MVDKNEQSFGQKIAERLGNFADNLDSVNIKTKYVRNMQEHEEELHDENNRHYWFMLKTGFSKQEIDYSLLMLIDRENIYKFLERIE